MPEFGPDGKVLTLGTMPREEALAALSSFDLEAAEDYDHGDPPWKHSSHVFGFIAPQLSGASLPVQDVGSVTPDAGLKGGRINVTLNRLRVAKYPGGGTHDILFEFSAENQVVGGSEAVAFSARYRVSEGGVAGLVGTPIFIGLGVGNNMMRFTCKTVNVQSSDDVRFLSFLDSDLLRKGLRLATTAQPAIGPLAAIATGITRSVIATRENLTIQYIDMGLDFGGTASGARLALGDYVAVQVPPDALSNWDWSKWIFKPATGQIVSNDAAAGLIPFNYVIFGISKYQD